jgi:hypothetical protein
MYELLYLARRFSGTLPTKNQILVLTPFLEIFQDLPVLCVKW